MTYVGLAYKRFGQGAVCIATDTFSGINTGHGKSSSILWRKILELTSSAYYNEPIYIALVDNRNEAYVNKLYDLSPVDVEEFKLDRLAAIDLKKYDIVFFCGLPEKTSNNISSKLYDYVLNGGSILIECPNIEGEIGILRDFESIVVDSLQSPEKNIAYWTESGKDNQIYTESCSFKIMVSIDKENFSNQWDVLLSNVETLYNYEKPIDSIGISNGVYFSQFSVSYGAYFKNGIVTVEETPESSSSSSSSSTSESSESYIESSSSSSQVTEWDVCDDLVAQWKMNDSRANNILDDYVHNVLNLAYLYSDNVKTHTSSKSIVGKINNAILFNGTTDFAKTVKTTNLRFNNGIFDEDFSIICWIRTTDNHNGPILFKNGIWEIGFSNNGHDLYFKKIDDDDNYVEFYGTIPNFNINNWNFIAITSYLVGTEVDIYVNQDKLSLTTIDTGYSGENNKTNELFMCKNNSGEFLACSLDNVMIFSRQLTEIEIEGLYNNGNGTENCEGIFCYTSSSSTSSSSIDSSSSSSSN